MHFRLRGYLGEIESEKTIPGTGILDFFMYFFFVNVQCCVRVSASKLQDLTRTSGGARALGNIVRFFAGPARTCGAVSL